MEEKFKHLEMIQGIVNRMASNSFYLKGWTVTLVAGIFALSAKDADRLFFLIAYIPILIFYILDTYYLQQERKYRNLYDKIRLLESDKIDFSMKITKDLCTEETAFCNCFLSITEVIFYVPLAIIVAGIIIII